MPSGGRVEANPGLVGQADNPFGSQHHWKGAKHAWQAPGRHHRHAVGDHLAPRNRDAVDSHDRTTATPGSGRTWAAWSASNDTACRVGVTG